LFSERGDWFLWDKGNLLPSPLFLYVLGSGWWADLLKYRGTPSQIFFIKGEGLFNAKISIFLMSYRFVGCPAILISCPGIRVVGRFIKIQGNLFPI
jgi:hypothetical protein